MAKLGSGTANSGPKNTGRIERALRWLLRAMLGVLFIVALLGGEFQNALVFAACLLAHGLLYYFIPRLLPRRRSDTPLVSEATLFTCLDLLLVGLAFYLTGDVAGPAGILGFLLAALLAARLSLWPALAVNLFVWLLFTLPFIVDWLAGASGALLLVTRNLFIYLALTPVVSYLRSMEARRERVGQDAALRLQQLSIVHEVSRTISSTLELDAVLDLVMNKAVELLDAEAGSLLLLEKFGPDQQTEALVFHVVLGPAADQLVGQRLPPGEGIAGAVLETGQPALVNRVEGDPRWYEEPDGATGFDTRSILAVPLVSRGRPIGVLEVINKRSTIGKRSTTGKRSDVSAAARRKRSTTGKRSDVSAAARRKRSTTGKRSDVSAAARRKRSTTGKRSDVSAAARRKRSTTGKRSGGLFDEHDLELLTTFASQAAVALENARLYEETHRRLQQVNTLYEVGRSLSTLDTNQVLSTVAQQTVEALGVDVCAVFLHEEAPTGESWTVLKALHDTSVAPGDSAASDALGARFNLLEHFDLRGEVRGAGYAIVESVETDEKLDEAVRRGLSVLGVRTCLFVGLYLHDQPRGLLIAGHRSETRHFSADDIQLCQALARQAIVAVENARLYEQTDEALTRRLHELATIEEIDHELGTSLDYDRIIDLVLRRAVEACNATSGALGILAGEGKKLEARVWSAKDADASIGSTAIDWPLDRGVVGRVVRSGEPTLLADVAHDPDYEHLHEGMRSE
ncbi:MAG: GAF domain-containing protein, partial [Anaerolineae bacterium]